MCAYIGSVWVLGCRVNEFDEQVGDVVFHGELASAFVIVPGEVYACIQISFTILGDVVMLF